MGFPVALTSGNYTSLRDDVTDKPSYWAAEYLSLCPGNVILAGQLNGTPTGNSFAQFAYDNVSAGAYTDVIPDMRLLVSHTNSQRTAYFDRAVRLDGVALTGATSTIVYCSENSYDFTDNDYFWIINDYPLVDWLPAFAGGAQFKRYNTSFRKLLPYVYGLKSAYAGWISDPANTATKLRIAFSITAKAADSGSTISAYLWTFPGSATVISGSTTTATVTIDFASSTGDWCHLRITDSNGNRMTRHFFVHAASDTYPPLLTASGVSITGAIGGGYNGSVEAWAGVSSIIDQTFCVAWDDEYYNGTKTSILENIKLVGRFRQQSPVTTTDQTFSQLQTVRYTIEGFSAQLARIEVLPHTLVPASSPSQWDEVKSLTLWRAIAFMLSEHSTFVNLCDLEFDDVTDMFLTAPLNTQKGNLLSMVQDLAQSTNSAWEFAPDGATRIYIDARYRTNLDRDSLPTVANFTSADWLELTIEQDPPTSVSKVNASGAYYDSTTTVETPLLAIWPGAAQDIGPDEITLARQYLQANSGTVSAQAQLNQRAGYRGAIEATKTRIVARFPDGYNFMVPSLSQWYTFTVAATDNALGLVYTTATRWLCIDVKYDHDNVTGTKSCTATFTIETTANVGQTVQYPSVSEIAPFVPDIPDFGPYDFAFPEDPSLFIGDTATNVDVPVGLAGQTGLKFDGSNLIDWSVSQLELLQNFLYPSTTTPQAREVTPPASLVGSMNIEQAAVDPFYASVQNKLPTYALLSDGTSDSKVVYSPDIASNAAAAGLSAETSNWQDGASTLTDAGTTGSFTVLRATKVSGGVMIYAVSANSVPIPPPPNCIMDVDFNRYATTVAGTIVASPSSGCHVASAALSTLGAPNVGGGLQATVRYTFATAVTINSLTLSYYGAAGGFAFIVEYFDNGGGSLLVTSFGSASSAVWVCGNDGLNHAPLAGVKHIDVSIRAPLAPPADNLLSDVEICFV